MTITLLENGHPDPRRKRGNKLARRDCRRPDPNWDQGRCAGEPRRHGAASQSILRRTPLKPARESIAFGPVSGGQAVVDRLASVLATIRVGDPLGQPQPFLGTLISEAAAKDVLAGQQKLLETGGRAIHLAKHLTDHPAALTPGLVEAGGNVVDDCELFGPLLIVQRAGDLQSAVQLANQTRYGLSAGLISDRRDSWEYFVSHINAGIVNWNRQTTGASGRLPFGGVGASGNHRPSGFFAADYCSFPVASMESGKVDLPKAAQVGLEDVIAQLDGDK